MVTATPRQLEAMIRLSEAHARMRLSHTISRDDVGEAIRLINVATQRAATDPRTGTIDMDLLTTGQGSMAKLQREMLSSRVADAVQGKRGMRMSVESIFRLLQNQGGGLGALDKGKLGEVLEACASDGVLRYNPVRQEVVVL